MKAKKSLVVLMSMLMAFAIGLVSACNLVTPEPDPTPLTITSEMTAEIEIGEPYYLTYECNGTVTVTTSGGSYDDNSHEFTATEAGSYVITVKATQEGYAENTATVNVTVIAGADKSAIATSLNKLSSLVEGDYTATTWNTLKAAKKAAEDAQTASGKTQDEIDSIVSNLESAISGLVPVAVIKAEISTDSFTYNSTIYKAEDYNNFADITAQIQTLNANNEITLKSQYNTALSAILDNLDAKLTLNIKSDLINNAQMMVEELVAYELTAESVEGATYEWKVNGEVKSTEATYEFTPEEFAAYTITCTVAKDNKENSKTLNVAFTEVDYVVNSSFTNGITVEDNVISVNEYYGWGDNEGKKVTVPDLLIEGDFTLYFDLTFTEVKNDGTRVMALFLLDENGNANTFWVAVRYQDNSLEVAFNGSDQKPFVGMPTNSVAIGNTMHFKMVRKVNGNVSTLYAYLLDDNGNVLTAHEPTYTKDYTGKCMIGIQSEESKFTVSNIAVGINDKAICKLGLNKALALSTGLIESDYTAASWATLTQAKAAANTATTQMELNEATAAIIAATNGLEKEPVAKAVVEETQITYADKTYVGENYINYDAIVAEINELNADNTVVLNSAYKTQVTAILNKLVTKVTLSVEGAPESVTYLVETLPTYTMTATTTEGATLSWKVNGMQVSNSTEYTFAPTTFGTYTIVCTAVKGEYSAEKEYVVTFVETDYSATKNSISIENNTITITEEFGWDDNKGRKVVLSDVTLSGTFTVYFDLTFLDHDHDPNVFALFFNNADGSIRNDWVAVTEHNNKLEVSQNEQKTYFDMPAGASTFGKVMHFKVVREIVNVDGNDRTVIKAYLLDDNGNVLTANDNNVSYIDYVGPVQLGIQSEFAFMVISNVRVNNGAQINQKATLRALVAEAKKVTVTDYVEGVANALTSAIEGATETLNKADALQAEIDEKLTALKAALADIKPENYAAVTKAVVTEDTITYSITGITLKADELYNFDAIAQTVNTLNGSNEYAANSVYTAALNEALNSADYVLNLSTLKTNLQSNSNYIYAVDGEYVLTVETKSKEVSYAWKVNGTEVIADETYVLNPENGKTYTVVITLSKTVNGLPITYEIKLENVSFMAANIGTPMTDRVTIDQKNGTATSATGIGWGDWEGRKVLYEDLVFNGSFAITMDLTYNEKVGGANVVTIHVLNTDTLSPNWGGDWAYVGYGCICLHENPVRLETNWSGSDKKQSSDEGFSAVSDKMAAVSSQLEVGDTFTVKLTVYKNAEGNLNLMYSLYDAENKVWIDFARTNWGGNFGNGLTVGINIENAGVTISNVRYQLLAGTETYIAGSVKSKVALKQALLEYENVVASNYVNGSAFLEAYQAAWNVYGDNAIDTNYDAALEALTNAYKALKARTLNVSVAGLDSGYTAFRGISQFVATIPEGATASWSYKLNGTEGSSNSATLALENGTYTNVVLTVVLGDVTESITYQNFTVSSLGLKSNTDKVVVNADNTVKVTDGAGWGQKDQLVFEGVETQEFELTFNVKYTAHDGGYRIFCLNLFGEEIQPVFGYRRDDGDNRDNRVQLGFDRPDKNYGYVENDTANENDNYDYLMTQAAKFSIKQTVSANGVITVVFSAYDANGNVIISASRNYIRWNDSKTDIRFTFENVNLDISNIQLMYL